MTLRLLRWVYRLLGRWYPQTAFLVQSLASYTIVVAGIGLLTVYERVTPGEFGILVAIGEGLMLLENLFSFRVATLLLRPARPWLRGTRTPHTADVAWSALAGLPLDYLRRWSVWPVLLNAGPFCIATAFVLDLAWYEVAILFVGCLLLLAYAAVLRFFLMELALQPVLERVSEDVRTVRRTRGALPLRVKLLVALPVANIVTGVVVAGLSSTGRSSLLDLGLDVGVALVVAFTVSLELTLLVARSVLRPVADLQRATKQVQAGDLTVRVPVIAADETGALAQSFNEMVEGLQERERLQEALGAFLDPGVAARVAREGALLAGEEVEVTAVFVDIRGFTALAERSTAAETVALLNAFYECVVPVVQRHRGHVNKFVADGLLAVFGAPERLGDHADRAVAAALELRDAVRDCFDGGITIGVGVNSGLVVAGTVGGGGRVDFTVIGDAVNTAARVEEATRLTGDDILITGATGALLRRPGAFVFEERPAVELRGKAQPVVIRAVIATAGGVAPTTPPAIPSLPLD